MYIIIQIKYRGKKWNEMFQLTFSHAPNSI